MRLRISILVACSANQVIGHDGKLPWRLSGDLKNFKRITMGHPILMGRKTLESIGRLLPGRTTIVLTRNREFASPGAIVVHDWDAAVGRAAECSAGHPEPELFVVGGAEIYRLALPYTQRIYLTRVHAKVAGDTLFPELSRGEWTVSQQSDHASDEKNEYAYSLLVLDRVYQ